MNQFQVVKSEFGQYYRVHSTLNISFPTGNRQKVFTDRISTLRFIHGLQVREGFWQSLSYEANGGIPYSRDEDIIEEICNMLMRGKIGVIEVQVLDPVSNPPEKRSIKDKNGKTIQFVPSTATISTDAQKTKKFTSKDDAKLFLNQLSPPQEKLKSIVEQLDLGPANGGAGFGSDDQLTENLAKALADGEAVAIEEQPSTGAKSSKNSEADKEKEDATNIPGMRQAGLGPEVEQKVVEVTCGICVAQSFSVTCSHGRKQGPSNVLQVVASPDRTSSEEYALMDVKVTIKKEFSGRDKVTSKLALKDNKFQSCYQISDGSETFNTAEKIFHLQGPMNEDTKKWPINAVPVVSSLTGKGCSGATKTLTVESYPSQMYSVEGNLDIFADWAEKVNKAWEKWGETIFSLSPVSLNPKITGPAGSFSAAWGWKENDDWRTYFDVSVSFGLNPILGVEIEISLSLVKLSMTAAGIPPSLSDLTAKHLADIALFGGAGCKGTLLGSPHAKFFADGKDEYDGQGKLSVEGLIKLGLKARVGSDYVVSASLIIYGETKVLGEDILDINRNGLFSQTLIMLDPFTAIAKVEIKYLIIFTKTEEKKWTPWEKVELYKSEKKKILPR